MKLVDLTILNITSFLKSQSYLQPVMVLFYMQNGLSVADFFFFQGIVCLAELLLGLPSGWLADKLQKKLMLMLACFMLLLRYLLWFCFRGYWIILVGELCYAFYKSLFQSSAEGYIYQYLCDRKIAAKNLHNYGKFNFATSMGSAVAALLGAVLFKEIGINVLLCIQIAVIAGSLLSLLFISPVSRATLPLENNHSKLFSFALLAQKLKTTDLKYYIALSALLTATTNLLVNTFQPLMILSAVPVILYGFVYFFNHISRAAAGFWAAKMIKYLGMIKLSVIVLTFFLISFAAIGMTMFYTPSAVLTIILLIFICLGIALQLCFSVGVTSYLQEYTSIDNRSMMASVNNTTIRLFSSVVLFLNTALLKHGELYYETFLGGLILLMCIALILRIKRQPEH